MPWWKRIHLPAMLALLVLVPASLGVPWWLERRSNLESGKMPPEPTPAKGSTAELAGSTWQFKATLVDTQGSRPAPPKGAKVVDAVFLVKPASAKAQKLLDASCEFHARDSRGRQWSPSTRYRLQEVPDNASSYSAGCTSMTTVGKDRGVIVSFVVPSDAVDSLGFEVGSHTSKATGEPRPAAVLFDQDDAEKTGN